MIKKVIIYMVFIFGLVTATILSSNSAHAYTLYCPTPDYPPYDRYGPDYKLIISCNGCRCECPHPHNEGEVAIAKPGQSIKCFSMANPYKLETMEEKAPMRCVGTGTAIVDCNGDSSVPAGDYVTLSTNQDGYELEPKLAEGFWTSFFGQLVPGSGSEVEAHLYGDLKGGEDNPDANLLFGSQLKALPFCENKSTHPCYDLNWKDKLNNCQAIPKGVDENGKSSFQRCIDTIQSGFLACLEDLDGPGGPWDESRTRLYFPNITEEEYMDKAAEAAKMRATECLEVRYIVGGGNMSYEGAFDAIRF